MSARKAAALNERAMLADLSIGYWVGRKRDKQVTENTLRSAHAEGDAGAFWTRIIPPSALKRISALVISSRALHWEMTLPWSKDGSRMLPSAMFLEYSRKMREAKEKFLAAVEEFLGVYPSLVANAPQRLGKLHKEECFPAVAKLRSKFSWSLTFLPLPDAEDFRVDLGDTITKQIKDDIQTTVNVQLQSATQDLWQRLFDAIARVAERLDDPEKIFRDSLISNVTELCDLLPRLNILDDPKLEEARQTVLAKITTRKPDDLRNDTDMRKATADEASKILDAMKAFLPKE